MAEMESWGAAVGFGALIVLIAMVTSAVLIVLCLPLFRRFALAQPNARAKHREPTPQGGGIAVFAATLIAIGVAVALSGRGGEAMAWLVPVLCAALLLAITGAIDDVRTLGAGPRIIVQLVAVTIAIVSIPDDHRILTEIPLSIERCILVIGGLWFVNLVNFMDGLDWITAAEVVPITAGLVTFGSLGALPPPATAVALAVLGAMAGFAPFNRPVAKLFLGDAGSLTLGLLIGWLLVLLAGSGHVVAALLLPSYYLADATITLLRRLLAGEVVWQAHRSHFYQRAADAGMSANKIVARIFVANVCLVALATATVAWPSWQINVFALAAGAVVVAALIAGFAQAPAKAAKRA